MTKTKFPTLLITILIIAAVSAVLPLILPFVSELSPSVLLATGTIIGGIVVALVLRPIPTIHLVESTESAELITQTLYVGNLPYRANETAVRELFAEYGHVVSVRLLKDKQTGKRRGFGFVEMSGEGAEAAIEALNDQEYQERTLKVRPANNRKENAEE